MNTAKQWAPSVWRSMTAVERERAIEAIQADARADLLAENARLKAEIFRMTASEQICVGAAGLGNFDELCGWIDGRKERLEAANARGDAALLDMERAITRLDQILTSTEEGTLPWWQKKHDDLALRDLKALAELCAKLEVARKHEVEMAQTIVDIGEKLAAETARANKLQAFFEAEYNQTCIHHNDEERKAAHCPVCQKARADRAKA